MNKNVPVVGTRFRYCRNENARRHSPLPRVDAEETWEGIVVRTCDAWTHTPAVELRRLDTGDLWHMKLNWWIALTRPSKESMDQIIISSVPEEE